MVKNARLSRMCLCIKLLIIWHISNITLRVWYPWAVSSSTDLNCNHSYTFAQKEYYRYFEMFYCHLSTKLLQFFTMTFVKESLNFMPHLLIFLTSSSRKMIVRGNDGGARRAMGTIVIIRLCLTVSKLHYNCEFISFYDLKSETCHGFLLEKDAFKFLEIKVENWQSRKF